MKTIKFLSRFFLFLLFAQVISCGFDRSKVERSGKVVRVIDGDTYDILIGGEQVRVRMEGIDAPERGMDFYRVAKNRLGELCMDKVIRLSIKEKDRYGRTIAKGYLPDGRELGEEMVKAGLAWHFKKYSDDPKLKAAEEQARAAAIGIWSLTDPVAPWDHRSQKRHKRQFDE
jgi:endonuclease YncB( thermonuclease family)